ncbi:MAG: sulfate/molybdate ABC transporter ATP-binding protein [Dehalococcoidia bacterium]
MSIDVKNLNKRFGSFVAVDNVSLRVEEGSLTALLGPSGSGKTTVLRMIAGLEIPNSGSIEINGADVSNVVPQRRNVGFVFQQYALFKHMKVADNIAFPLKVRKWKKDAIRDRVAELLALLRIDGLEKRYPDQISGGQRQRVALARALAAHPSVLLLDEPFSALDARVRDELREWLRSLHEQLHVTSVFVTHDQTEAMELADRVVIMREGRIVQAGAPEEILNEPNSSFVMNFLGRANALPGHALHGMAYIEGLQLPYAAANGTAVPVVGYFRPRQVDLSVQPIPAALRVRVERVLSTGVSAKVSLETENGLQFVADVDTALRHQLEIEPGRWLYAAPRNVQVYASSDSPVPSGGRT